MEKIKVGDIEVAYRRTGKGPDLVMIMGLTATLDWWDPSLIDSLSERFSVLVFDNRGAGRTEAPEGKFSVEQFADDTAGLMDALEIERAEILGFSMGGMIAQEMALRHPEKVNRLVLCATYPGGKTTVPATPDVLMKLADRSGTPDELAERALTLMFDRAWMKANRPRVDELKQRYLIAPTADHNAARQFMATLTFDACDRLPGIDKPTLVACGADDVLIPPVNSRNIAGQVPGAKLLEYEGAGHGFLWQFEDKCCADLHDFLG